MCHKLSVLTKPKPPEQDTVRKEGVLLGILVEVCRPVLQFPDPISDQFEISFSTPVFRPGRDQKTHYVYKERNYIIIARIRTLWAYFLFIWNHRRICSYTTVAPSKTTDPIPDQNMGKVYTRFQTEMAQNTYPLGRHIPTDALYKGVPPGDIAINGKQGKGSKAPAAAHPRGHIPAETKCLPGIRLGI